MEIIHKGFTVLIDEADYDIWKSYSWHFNKQNKNKDNYRVISGNGKCLHRLIAERIGFDMKLQVDHINGSALDNRRANLRPATIQQNNCNKGIKSTNKSGYKGVFWSNGKWQASIRHNGKSQYLGRYVNIDDAITAYREAAIKYQGEFVRFS